MYQYTLCGLPNVYLNNGYIVESTQYGEVVSIQNVKGLHQSIGLSLIESPNPLTSYEVRYLRKEMDLSQKALAEILNVKSVTVRKWESEANVINGAADRLLRALYKESVVDKSSIMLLVEKIAKLDQKIYAETKLQFRETDHGWQKEAA